MNVLQLTVFVLAATLVIAFADEVGQMTRKWNKTIFKKSYIKHSVLVVLASIVIISFREPLNSVIGYVLSIYEHLVAVLINAFGVAHVSVVLLLRIFVLLLFSFVPALILSGLYWLTRQQTFPGFYLTLWASWLVLVFAII